MALKAKSCRLVTVLLVILCFCVGVASIPSAWAQSPDKAKNAQKVAASKARAQSNDLLAKAKKALIKGDITKADLFLQDAAKVDPKNVQVAEAQSLFYLGIKNYPNAAKALERLEVLEPGNKKNHRLLGVCYLDGFDYKKAEPIWREICEQDPDDVEAKLSLAKIAYHNNDNETADSLISDAFELEPTNMELMLYKARVDLRNNHYQEARQRMEEILTTLPSNHPMRPMVEASLEEARVGLRNKIIFEAFIIIVPIVGIIVGLVIYRMSRKVSFKAPPMELDAASVDSVCRFVLTHVTNITGLPRGLCWTVTLDGRYLELQVSELIASQSALALSPIDSKSLKTWVENHGRAPFLFKVESKEAGFLAAFPNLVEDLTGVEINIGVPIIFKNRLHGLALLGRSRSDAKSDLRKRFDECSARVQDVAEQGAVALDRLRSRNLKVLDSKTGLYNRDYFETNLVNIYRGCHIAQVPLALFMLRLDQYSAIYDEHDEDYCTDVLYELAQSIQKYLNAEVGVTLCHLDNGVFALIAPERDAQHAEAIAMGLKGAIDSTVFSDRSIKPTGCVAYGIFPEDADDPKMLRSVTGRAFRDANFLNGNRVVRAEKVSKAGEGEEKEVVDEVVVTRRTGTNVEPKATGAEPKAEVPFGISPLLLNQALEKDRGGAGASLSTLSGSSDLKPKINLAASDDDDHDVDDDEELEGTDVELEGEGSDEGEAFTIVPELDEYGVDLDTQFCSQETFEDVVKYEVSLAEESGEESAVVFVHIDNLTQVRAKGKTAYVQLRHDLAALICAFLRDEIDVPGLVGEDDFAIFLTGTDEAGAVRLADRINLTAANLDAKGEFVVPAIGVAIRKSGDKDGVTLIDVARQAAHGAGIHVAGRDA